MTARGSQRAKQQEASAAAMAFEPTFWESLEPSLQDIAKHGIMGSKESRNAGASDTERLYLEV